MKRIWIPASLVMSLVSIQAMADGCDTLKNNKKWDDDFAKMQDAYLAQNYYEALDIGSSLYGICPRSPALNYMMAKSWEQLGDDSKKLFYLQVATRNSADFKLDPDVLEQMWIERVFAEHPELSPDGLEKQKEAYQKQVDETEKIQASYDSMEIEFSQARQLNADAKALIETENLRYKALMWSGVGIAAAGIALTVGGAVWNVTMGSPLRYDSTIPKDEQTDASSKAQDYETYKVRIGSSYAASWTLIGAGVATTVLGAALTGYAGYRYTHPEALAVSVVPNGMVISGVF